MLELRSTADLIADGYTKTELARLVRRGGLVRVQRGAYAAPAELDGPARHRRLVHAVVPGLADDVVVSHASAAVLHGLPLWGVSLSRVQVTRVTASSGRRRLNVHLHAARLRGDEVVTIGGLRVTSLARTVADLARSHDLEAAVVTGDAALRSGLARDDLAACLASMESWPGIVRARRAVGFLDARSESAGESRSRVRMAVAGLPAPTPQLIVRTSGANFVGRVDFGWEEFGTIGEFDGREKYGRLLKDGERPADAVYREKLREDALRAAGWQVVRWTWAELDDFGGVATRLQHAFGRGHRIRA